MVKLYFLGTSGSKPTKKRGMPSIAVEIGEDIILLDCGEGTQRQIMYANINPNRITHVFITHLHGDHMLGLHGLIWSMGLDLRRKNLYVYGPKELKDYLEFMDNLTKPFRLYKVIVNEVKEGKVCETDKFEVYAIKTKHSIESYAYKIKEKDKPPRISKEKLKELNIQSGPYLRKLKEGKEVVLPDGRIIKPSDVLTEPKKGKVIVYTGDTAPFEELIEFAKDADVLIHEATFGDDEEVKARKYRHSTARDAAKIAKAANVKTLVLTHIGVRYDEGDILLLESKEVFENTILAHDFLTLEV
jgi:ribonuclease Z